MGKLTKNLSQTDAAAKALAAQGRAAILSPDGSGQAEAAWAWAAAHPGVPLVWLTCSEERRALRTAEARQQGRAQEAGVQLVCASQLENYTPAQWVELAAQRPGCIVLDSFRGFAPHTVWTVVARLRAYCPGAVLLGLASPDEPELCYEAEALFAGAAAWSETLAQSWAAGHCPRPARLTALLWPVETALQAVQTELRNLHAPGEIDPLQHQYTVLCAAVERCGAPARLLAQALPAGRWFALCEDDAALERAKALWQNAGTVALQMNGPGVGLPQEGFAAAVLVRSTADPAACRLMLQRALAVCGSVPVAELNACLEGLADAAALCAELEAAGGTPFPVAEPFRAALQQGRIMQKALDAKWNQYCAALKKALDDGWQCPELKPRCGLVVDGLIVGRWLENQLQIHAGQRPGRMTLEQEAKLEKLGVHWRMQADRAWERGYAAALRYRRTHADLLPNVFYHDPEGFPLGEWLTYHRQRRANGEMPPERIARLEAIGMVWDTGAAQWEENYAAALQYYLEHRDLEVPIKYVTPAGLALGTWLGSQRGAHQRGTLSEEQTAKLEALHVDWANRNDRKWMRAYQAAVRYYKHFGNLDVPSGYVDPDGVLLGKWVFRQRYAWQNPARSSARVSSERKRMLDKIGMVWADPDAWEHRYDLAMTYKKEHGDLEMPADYETADGIRLAGWLKRQKHLLRQDRGGLPPARSKALRELFRGEPTRRKAKADKRESGTRREKNWNANYRRARTYYRRRGDLLVPASYVDEGGFRLGVWISNLRAARKLRPDSPQVTPAHIALLDAIGMEWDAREAKWQVALQRAAAYRKTHGDLQVPVNYKSDDGFCLGDWVRRMRTLYAAHDEKLTAARIQALEGLGMAWGDAAEETPA